MARLFLKLQESILKEVILSQGVVTIGRLPDNLVQISELAVSGHHAKIYWERDHYVLEDMESMNGTYLNNQRVSQAALKAGDTIRIASHAILFQIEPEEKAGDKTMASDEFTSRPELDAAVMAEIGRTGEMLPAATERPPRPPSWQQEPVNLSAGPANSSSPQASLHKAAEAVAAEKPRPASTRAPQVGIPALAPAVTSSPTPTPKDPISIPKVRTGMLNVVEGKTDEAEYVLSGMTVIGKSEMASIKLKGWFAPKMAALIHKREDKYLIAASEKEVKVTVNGQAVSGQLELHEGDLIEVAGVKMRFRYQD